MRLPEDNKSNYHPDLNGPTSQTPESSQDESAEDKRPLTGEEKFLLYGGMSGLAIGVTAFLYELFQRIKD